MKAILVVVVMLANGTVQDVTMQEFDDFDSCFAAANHLVELDKSRSVQLDQNLPLNINVQCLGKSKALTAR